jgi:hypothetical protein
VLLIGVCICCVVGHMYCNVDQFYVAFACTVAFNKDIHIHVGFYERHKGMLVLNRKLVSYIVDLCLR